MHPFSFGELSAVNAFEDDLIINILRGLKNVASNRSIIRKYHKANREGDLDWAFSPLRNYQNLQTLSNSQGNVIPYALSENDSKISYPIWRNGKLFLTINIYMARALK